MLMVTLFLQAQKGSTRRTATCVRVAIGMSDTYCYHTWACLQSASRSCISPAQWYTFIQPFCDLKQYHACTYECPERPVPRAHHRNAGLDESHMSSSYRLRASKQDAQPTKVALISPPQPSPHRFAKRKGFRRSTELTVRPMEAAHKCIAPMQ